MFQPVSPQPRMPDHLAVLMILVLLCLPIGVSKASAQTRVLQFPEDKPIGLLYGRPNVEHESIHTGWELLSKAQGDVPVPADLQIRLDVSKEAVADLSALRALRPDDLWEVMVWRSGGGDDMLDHIAHLTGLKALRLDGNQITGDGLKKLAHLKNLEYINLSGTLMDDVGLSHLKPLISLRTIMLWNTEITNDGMAHLVALPHLQELGLGITKITDPGLAYVGRIKTLENLRFGKNFVTDEGLEHLSGLHRLKILTLVDTKVSDNGMVHLGKLEALESLRMMGTQVRDDGIFHLTGLKNLEYIEADRLTDKGLASLSTIRSLRSIHLFGRKYTDAGLSEIAKLPHLEELNIGGSGITDKGMTHLAKCTSLEVLTIQSTGVTGHGLGAIAQLPHLKRLTLHNNAISNEGLAHLKKLASLKHLALNENNMNDVGLGHLRDLNLTHLELGRSVNDDSTLAHIAHMESLEQLTIEFKLTDNGLRHLSGLRSLQSLAAFDTTATDKGLASLANLDNLEYVQVFGQFTDHGLDHLRQLPRLRYLQIGSRTISDEGWQSFIAEMPSLQDATLVIPDSNQQWTAQDVGAAAPDIETTMLDGLPWRLSDKRGQVVVVHFWATWCAPCVASTPDLKRWHDDLENSYGERFEMISISLDDRDFLPLGHAQHHGLTWPQARIGLDSPIRTAYGVRGVPTYYVIAPDGRIISDSRNWAELRQAVVRAIPDEK